MKFSQALFEQIIVAIAPVIARKSLEVGADKIENAHVTLDWSLELAKRYTETCEALTIASENAPTQSEQQTPAGTQGLRKTQARISVSESPMSDLRSASGGRPPQERPQRDPLDPYR